MTHDIREQTFTFTREELALMVERAALELTKVKEIWSKRLEDKDKEAMTVLQAAQSPPTSQAKVEAHLTITFDAYGMIPLNIVRRWREGNGC